MDSQEDAKNIPDEVLERISGGTGGAPDPNKYFRLVPIAVLTDTKRFSATGIARIMPISILTCSATNAVTNGLCGITKTRRTRTRQARMMVKAPCSAS